MVVNSIICAIGTSLNLLFVISFQYGICVLLILILQVTAAGLAAAYKGKVTNILRKVY